MGLERKLERAYQDGFEAGMRANQPTAETRGEIRGAHMTWNLIEKMFTDINGIGPKTKEKILKAVKEYSTKEKKKLQQWGKWDKNL